MRAHLLNKLQLFDWGKVSIIRQCIGNKGVPEDSPLVHYLFEDAVVVGVKDLLLLRVHQEFVIEEVALDRSVS